MEADYYRLIPALIPILFLVAFLLYPASLVLVEAFRNVRVFSDILSSSYFWRILNFTLTQAIISTLLSALLGYVAGFVLAKYEFPGRRLFSGLILVPFIMPSVVAILGFTLLYGYKGFLSARFQALRVLGEGYFAIIAAHVFYNAPLVASMVSSSLSRLDPEIEEASEVLGADFKLKFLKIYLPQSLPGLVSGSILTFLYCFTSFAIPLVLGGVKYRTLEVEIYSYYKILFDYDYATALAVFQLLILLSISLLYTRYVIARAEEIEPGYGRATRREQLKLREKPLLALLVLGFTALLAAFLFLPLLSVILYSLRNPYTGSIDFTAFLNVLSFRENPYLGVAPLTAVVNSLYYSALAAFIALAVGSLAVEFSRGLESRWARVTYQALFYIPLAVSPITLALGLYRAYGIRGPFSSQMWPLIVISYVIASLPLVTRSLSAGLSRIPPEILEAGEVLGEDPLDNFLKLKMPLAWNSFLSAFLLSFGIGLGEFSATLFLLRPEYTTMTVAVYKFMGSRRFQEASVMAALLVVLSSLTFALAYKLTTRRGE